MKAETIPFDIKMKVIRTHLSGFWIFETERGTLEARLDYAYFTTFIGDCVYVNEIVDEVFEQLNNDLASWCVVYDEQ